MAKVVHFEINADEPERAVEFYRTAFNWKIEKWDGTGEYWMCTSDEPNAEGIDGAIKRRDTPHAGVYNTIAVASIQESLQKVIFAGGKQNGPIEDIPGVGFFTYCTDPEGNIFGLLEPNEMAK